MKQFFTHWLSVHIHIIQAKCFSLSYMIWFSVRIVLSSIFNTYRTPRLCRIMRNLMFNVLFQTGRWRNWGWIRLFKTSIIYIMFIKVIIIINYPCTWWWRRWCWVLVNIIISPLMILMDFQPFSIFIFLNFLKFLPRSGNTQNEWTYRIITPVTIVTISYIPRLVKSWFLDSLPGFIHTSK